MLANIFMDLLGIINIIAHLLEVKIVGADVEKSRIGRLMSYWKLLLLDILSYCSFYDWFLLNYPYFRLFKLIPIITLRFGDYYKTVEQKSRVNPIYLRIVKSVIYLSIVVHWLSVLLECHSKPSIWKLFNSSGNDRQFEILSFYELVSTNC